MNVSNFFLNRCPPKHSVIIKTACWILTAIFFLSPGNFCALVLTFWGRLNNCSFITFIVPFMIYYSFKDLVHLNVVSTGTLPYFCMLWFPCCNFFSSWDNRTSVPSNWMWIHYEFDTDVSCLFSCFTQFLNFRSLMFSELKCSSQPSCITLFFFLNSSICLYILEQFLKFILFPLNRPPAVEPTFSLFFLCFWLPCEKIKGSNGLRSQAQFNFTSKNIFKM